MMDSTGIRRMCLAGIFIALVVVLSAYFQIPLGTSIRLDIGYAVVVVAAMHLGAGYGCAIALLARIINDLIFSGSISFWWAIGSAFWGLAIGLTYVLAKKVPNTKIRVAIISVAIVIISFVSFAGIVPIIAACVGLEYNFMFGIGILASIADAIVALLLGYPLHELLTKIKLI